MERDDDDETPVELVPRASAERRSITNLGLAIRAIGDAVFEAAGGWDRATPDQRRSLAVDLSIRLGDGGDILHEARRLIRSFAD